MSNTDSEQLKDLIKLHKSHKCLLHKREEEVAIQKCQNALIAGAIDNVLIKQHADPDKIVIIFKNKRGSIYKLHMYDESLELYRKYIDGIYNKASKSTFLKPWEQWFIEVWCKENQGKRFGFEAVRQLILDNQPTLKRKPGINAMERLARKTKKFNVIRVDEKTREFIDVRNELDYSTFDRRKNNGRHNKK